MATNLPDCSTFLRKILYSGGSRTKIVGLKVKVAARALQGPRSTLKSGGGVRGLRLQKYKRPDAEVKKWGCCSPHPPAGGGGGYRFYLPVQ